MRTRSAASTNYQYILPDMFKNRPKEGTKLRAAYDLFLANAGHPVASTDKRDRARLKDFYGMEFRHHSANHYALVGIWYDGDLFTFDGGSVKKASVFST